MWWQTRSFFASTFCLRNLKYLLFIAKLKFSMFFLGSGVLTFVRFVVWQSKHWKHKLNSKTTNTVFTAVGWFIGTTTVEFSRLLVCFEHNIPALLCLQNQYLSTGLYGLTKHSCELQIPAKHLKNGPSAFVLPVQPDKKCVSFLHIQKVTSEHLAVCV